MTCLTEALVLRDPDVPATGNPDGDINIVEWFDYNCPYCRKIAPEIQPGGAGRRQGPPGAEGLADPWRGLEIRGADGAGSQVSGQVPGRA